MKGGFKVPDFKMPGMAGNGKKGGSNKLVGGAQGDETTLVVTEGSEEGQYSVKIISKVAAAANNREESMEEETNPVVEGTNPGVEGTNPGEETDMSGGKRRKRKTAAKKSKKGSTRKGRK